MTSQSVTGWKGSDDPRALVLEAKGKLSLRPCPVDETLGPNNVRIAIHTVGICGSDVHYYTHGAIGQFVVNEPMILGHEASGVVVECGKDVRNLAVGDRVCMEPGIPNAASKAAQLGLYNLDPEVQFWATPPVHGVLRSHVVHPAAYTFKLPDQVSFAAGAMVEPLAVGVHAVAKARAIAGNIAVVLGAGPIGMVTVLAAKAAGCSKIYVTDIDDSKLDVAAQLGPVEPINILKDSLEDTVMRDTDGWGADVVYECSGVASAAAGAIDVLRPGGTIVFVGIPLEPIPYDISKAQIKEARIEHVFRYAHIFPNCVNMLASGAIDVSPLITKTLSFEQSVEAFELASTAPTGQIKMQISFEET